MRAIILPLILAVAPALAADASPEWHWIKAGFTTEEWFVSEGTAEVVTIGQHFTATLFRQDSKKDIAIVLRGTIENGKIKAVETIQGSDYTGSTYHGTLATKKLDNFAGHTGVESISLSDGWSLIGIRRTL